MLFFESFFCVLFRHLVITSFNKITRARVARFIAFVDQCVQYCCLIRVQYSDVVFFKKVFCQLSVLVDKVMSHLFERKAIFEHFCLWVALDFSSGRHILRNFRRILYLIELLAVLGIRAAGCLWSLTLLKWKLVTLFILCKHKMV